MKKSKIYNGIQSRRHYGYKSLAVFLHPDLLSKEYDLFNFLFACVESEVDYFIIGSTAVLSEDLSKLVSFVKKYTSVPVVLLPGGHFHLDGSVDGIMLTTFISGRNPELLIGNLVTAAPVLRKSDLEILSAGYIMVNDNRECFDQPLTGNESISFNNPSLAASTAMAGEMMGMQMIYLDTGIYSEKALPLKVLNRVRKSVEIPIWVQGGLSSAEKVKQLMQNGADTIILNYDVMESPEFINKVGSLKKEYNRKVTS